MFFFLSPSRLRLHRNRPNSFDVRPRGWWAAGLWVVRGWWGGGGVGPGGPSRRRWRETTSARVTWEPSAIIVVCAGQTDTQTHTRTHTHTHTYTHAPFCRPAIGGAPVGHLMPRFPFFFKYFFFLSFSLSLSLPFRLVFHFFLWFPFVLIFFLQIATSRLVGFVLSETILQNKKKTQNSSKYIPVFALLDLFIFFFGDRFRRCRIAKWISIDSSYRIISRTGGPSIKGGVGGWVGGGRPTWNNKEKKRPK